MGFEDQRRGGFLAALAFFVPMVEGWVTQANRDVRLYRRGLRQLRGRGSRVGGVAGSMRGPAEEWPLHSGVVAAREGTRRRAIATAA